MGAEINSSFLCAPLLIITFCFEFVIGNVVGNVDGSPSEEEEKIDPKEWDLPRGGDLPWWAILLIVGGVLGLFLVLCVVYNKCGACRGN